MTEFDETIQTEFISDITENFIDIKKTIGGYQYSMFQTTVLKDNIEYYCERINIKSERNVNGIHGLFFSNNQTENTGIRFEGTEIDTEDPRLFICNHKIYVIFNAISPFPNYRRSIGISTYDYWNPIFLYIEDEREHVVEKNWSPCVVKNEFYLIYLLDPLIVLHYNFNPEGKCTIVYKQKPEISIQQINTSSKCLRGSSSFIPFYRGVLGELYIGVCHSYIYKNNQHYYFAYLCVINVSIWKIVYVSKPIPCKGMDIINKYKDTDIIINYERYYYIENSTGNKIDIDLNVVYPTSIYQESESESESESELKQYIIILNLNKYSLQNKITIDFVDILQKIMKNQTIIMDWDDIVRDYSMKIIENL